jgi:hypothetical protein
VPIDLTDAANMLQGLAALITSVVTAYAAYQDHRHGKDQARRTGRRRRRPPAS